MPKEKGQSEAVAEVKKEISVVKPPEPRLPFAEAREEEGIDKVRDILFGAKVRQYEQKFKHLEDLIQKEIANLRSETTKSADTLETYVKKEMEALSDQVKNEQTERAESAEELSGKIDRTVKGIEKKTGQLSEKVIATQRDLQEQVLQQSKSLMEEIRSQNSQISSSLDRSVNDLRTEKMDRLAFADLLMEVAMRLKDEFKIPEVE
jgi:small-conductance mechanosensitive channel